MFYTRFKHPVKDVIGNRGGSAVGPPVPLTHTHTRTHITKGTVILNYFSVVVFLYLYFFLHFQKFVFVFFFRKNKDRKRYF